MIEILNGIQETVEYHGINGVRLYHNDQNENYPIHWHTAIEVIMPLRSGYTTEICDIRSTFYEGDIFLIPPGELHSLSAPPVGERLILLFDYSLVSNLVGMDSLLHSLHPFRLLTKEEYPELTAKLSAYLYEIEREYFSRSPFMESCIYSLLIRFFVELGRSTINGVTKFPNITSNKQQEYVEKFMSVCKHIGEHCCEDLPVEAMASMAGFSKFHFIRLFKQFTGTTYNDYLTRKRILHAEKLLIQPGMNITEAALQSGFNSLSTFNRVFKAHKKCSPSEYKTLNYIKEDNIAESGYHTTSHYFPISL
ncbi:MAG: helix-turn-helix domain-containing protein [Vallitaleaceae bacterium]|nr:helix-turn-helix domain-containing protein [Vallitaleaceae bacterium]